MKQARLLHDVDYQQDRIINLGETLKRLTNLSLGHGSLVPLQRPMTRILQQASCPLTRLLTQRIP